MLKKNSEKDKTKTQKDKTKTKLFKAPITSGKIAIYCLFAAVLIGLFFLGRFVYRTAINPASAFDNPPETTEPVKTPEATDPQTPDQTATPEPTVTLSPRELLEQSADHDFMKNRVNVLLTGIDYSIEREGRTDFRTDTILLMTINFDTGKVDMISVPRDSYADIAFTDAKWKINGAYMTAGGREGNGFECMMKTVSDCLGGIPIDYYIAVEMQAVKDIVDIMGGVWYDVDYEFTMNGRHHEKGYQKLCGQDVLDYMRLRKGVTGSSDINRIDRQQRLLMDVFSQLKDGSLIEKIPDMYKTLQDEVMTNMNFEQIVALSLFGLDFDMETQFERYTLKGEYMAAYNASKYYVLDHEYTEEIIEEVFGVKPSINWDYSIKYVTFDNARINLGKLIKETKQLLVDNQETLSLVYTLVPLEDKQDPIKYFAFQQIGEEYLFIKDKLSTAEFRLEDEDTEDMLDAIEMLEELNEQLEELIKTPPQPTPTPTPEPTPTPTPEPTETPTETPDETPDPTPDETPDSGETP